MNILFLGLSVAGLIAAAVVPAWSDLILIAGPCMIASLIILFRAVRRKAGAVPVAGYVVVDGSNVMHWKDGKPQIDTVISVLAELRARGFAAGVVFDANAGYLLFGQYRHDNYFSDKLNLPTDRVMVVPKGTPADPFILDAARDLGARIVTNDRFRDWTESYPEARTKGHLIRGGYNKSGALWLDLEQGPDAAAA